MRFHLKGFCMQWLRDTWNGLVVVLLKPYLPRWATILALLLGIGIGFLGAYVLFPTQYYDGDVLTLEQSWQDEWVKLLADRNAAANADVSANIIELLSQIDDPLSVINRLLNDPTEQENYGKLQAFCPMRRSRRRPLRRLRPCSRIRRITCCRLSSFRLCR